METEETFLPDDPRAFTPILYGFNTHGRLFAARQLVALTTFCDLVQEAHERVKRDALTTGMADDGRGLTLAELGAMAYADAVAVYLAFAVDKGANYWSSVCAWHTGAEMMISTYLVGRRSL